MATSDTVIDIDPSLIYQQYSPPLAPTTTINISDSTSTVISVINGNSGKATGPSLTLSGGSTGYAFAASANSVVLTVSNAATVRTSISAAKSGSNDDITDFTGLTGNTGFNAWTGTPDQASHATFSGTASAAYVQAEMQAVMDSLQQATGFIMALLTAMLAYGGVEN